MAGKTSKRGKAKNKWGGGRHHGGSRSQRPRCTCCGRPFTKIDRHDPTPLCRCADELSEPSALQHFVQLFGIDAARVYIGVFVFECAAVALAAGLVAPRSPILTSMGFDEVILTFVVVVLGGIGSVGGSLVAGFGLGLFTALFGALVSPAYTTAAAFLLLLVVLVARPRGLSTR